ncbi:hypothetical protein FisN_5Lh212 [Fistulifera solaris]|uniref:Uncharacterized protein n=1 Tax=Fistulifera solaris TaxID=1519565 RepID=A0A1Z5JJE5_FISSO|nr:hypothetical protein FisN_5Lh212 [Fistulifera solaris]|eukprot:GAX13891.1 hypothetical protein FisN_5Lh212 [Fistulifera solaris]
MEDSRKHRKPDFVKNSSNRAHNSRSYSDESGSILLPRRSENTSKKVKEDEVDFYDSPTTLSRLILHQKYESALRRLGKAPYEASTWVSAIRALDDDDDETIKTSITINSSVQFSFRQMPLHTACGELARVKDRDSVYRGNLEHLIRKLVTVYPDAATKRDHDNKLPLHEALWHLASPQTVSILLMAYPEAAEEQDIFGRTSLQIVQSRRGGNTEHKEAIMKMLLKRPSFWKLARKEMTLKMKHGRVPSAGASVNSQSVLNDSQADADDYTIATRESIAASHSGSGGSAPLRYGTKVANPRAKKKKSPVAWDQLEQRAQRLEYMLAEHNEENFRLAEEINRLKEIEAKYEKLTSTEVVARQVIQLEKENAELTKTVNDLKRILQRNDITAEEMTQHTKPLEIVVGRLSSAMSVTESVNKSMKSRNSSHLTSGSTSKVPSSISLNSSQSVKSSLMRTRSTSRESAKDDASTLSGVSRGSGEWSVSVADAEEYPVLGEVAKRSSTSAYIPPTTFRPMIPPRDETSYADHTDQKTDLRSSLDASSAEARLSLEGTAVAETPIHPTTDTPNTLASSAPSYLMDESPVFSWTRRGGKPQKEDTRARRVENQIQTFNRYSDPYDPTTLCVDSLEVIPEADVMVPSRESAEVARLRKERENLQSLVKDLVRDLNKKRVKRQTLVKGGEADEKLNSGTSKGGFDAYRSLLMRSNAKSSVPTPPPVVNASASVTLNDPLTDYQTSLQRDSDSVSQRSGNSSSNISKVLKSL